MKVRSLIMDWSGTLVDDLQPVWVTTNHVLAAHGAPALALEQFRREFCLPVRKCYARWLPGRPVADLETVFLTEYRRHWNLITILPHTRAFLEFCTASGRPVFIASSVDVETYATTAARLGIDQFITRPYLGIEDKTEKIHHILAENRLVPEETLFVGDMEHDIEAGRAGGVRTCAVLTGYNHGDMLQASGPDLVCAHLGELQEQLGDALCSTEA